MPTAGWRNLAILKLAADCLDLAVEALAAVGIALRHVRPDRGQDDTGPAAVGAGAPTARTISTESVR